MALAVEEYKAFNPMDVGLLGADTVMSPANDIANLIEQSGPRRWRFDGNLPLAVFPTKNDSHL
jgi:hypothetical protein